MKELEALREDYINNAERMQEEAFKDLEEDEVDMNEYEYLYGMKLAKAQKKYA